MQSRSMSPSKSSKRDPHLCIELTDTFHEHHSVNDFRMVDLHNVEEEEELMNQQREKCHQNSFSSLLLQTQSATMGHYLRH